MFLAGVNFLFLVASVGLCFVFVMKTLLITQMLSLVLSRACTEAFSVPSRPFLLLTSPARRLGETRSGGKTQLGHLTPTDLRDVLDHVASCPVCKAGVGKEARKLGAMVFAFPSHRYV